MTENEQHSGCSEDNSSLGDDERIRKLFQVSDGAADGYIDSQDLISVCRELNIEDSVEELIQELGVDGDGRISFSDLLRRRTLLRHDVDPLQSSRQRDYPASSNNSLGAPSGSKNDRWEFDSGARDLSPEPHTLQKLMEVATAGSTSKSTNSANLLQLANKLHFAALASLRSEILDLSSRLQSVTEERDLLEKSLAQSQSIVEASVAQEYEDRITKLQSVIADLSCEVESNKYKGLVIQDEEDDHTLTVDTEQNNIDCSNNFHEARITDELPDLYYSNDVACNTSGSPLLRKENEELKDHGRQKPSNRQNIEELMQTIIDLQAENAKLHAKLSVKDIEKTKLRSSFIGSEENQHWKARESSRSARPAGQSERVTVIPLHQNPPIPKIAERVRLRRMDRQVTGSDIASLGVSHTEVAEYLVSSVLEQCDLLEIGNDHRKFEIETERLISKLEHTRAFNTLLQSSLEEVKSYCERLTLLVGKYENNAIALQLSMGCCDRIIRSYEELVMVLSNGRSENFKTEEKHLIQSIDELKKERSTIEGAVVQLESYVECTPPSQPQITTQTRKLDLETAVLIQEVMSMREEKADLNATIYRLEKEKESLELKLTTMETQQQTQLATVQHLKVLHEIIPDNQQKYGEVQKEKILREQLKEMAAAVERISRNAEIRQKQHADMMVELRTTNSSLLKTIEKNRHKYEAKLHRLEGQMLTMVSRHAAQVQTLKQRILQLLDSKNSDHQW